MTEEMITISKAVYDELCQESLWLSCLEAAGVDNWDGFDYALEIMDEKREKESK